MEDAALRNLTYSRGDICDRTINTEYLQYDCPLDQTSSKKPSASVVQGATASLGYFDKLPLEIAENILSHLDLGCLTLLRSVSMRMSLIVDSTTAYGKVATHSPHALRALLSTRTARYFTANNVFNALRAQGCFFCGGFGFGAFLYILECRRCCWQCLTTVEDLLPISLASAKRIFSFDPQKMDTTPILLSLPGFYSVKKHNRPNQKEPKGGRRVNLVAYGAVPKLADFSSYSGAAGETVYEKAKRHTAFALRDPRYGHATDVDIMNTDPIGYRAGYAREPQRFMAAVRFPTLDNHSDTIEWGLSCMICLEKSKGGDEERFWNEQYSKDDIVGHVEGCQTAEQARRDQRYKAVKKLLARPTKYPARRSVHGSAE